MGKLLLPNSNDTARKGPVNTATLLSGPELGVWTGELTMASHALASVADQMDATQLALFLRTFLDGGECSLCLGCENVSHGCDSWLWGHSSRNSLLGN